MKKTKRFALAIMACLMSVISMAGNRQVSTVLPAETPSVTVTLEGKQHVVKPTKVIVKEVDASHVECIVYADKDNAKVMLPIAYNTILEIGLHAAEWARGLNVITEDQWEQVYMEYRKQVGSGSRKE